jgi:DNA repair exonuclease SbcCD ATPase subunit
MGALELYLQGLSANEIVAKTGISKGAVISILRDAREGNFPSLELRDRIDELHSLSVRLRKEGLDLTQAKLGFALFERLLAMDIEPERIKEWIEFCSEISPSPPEGFVSVAMELFQIEKESGKNYDEIASEAKELSTQRDKLISEVVDLKAKEIRAKKLRDEIEGSQEEVEKLRAEKNKLESTASSLDNFLQKRSEKLGISLDELETRFKELVSLEEELAVKKSEKNKLKGEVEALSERHQKLSSQMDKASADFERDIKLIKEMRNELIKTAEMKGRYEAEVKDMEWAKQILPFLRYPDKVDDPDLKLVSVVIGCIDKWLPMQKLGFPPQVKWGDITRYVQSKRAQLR